MTDPATLAVNLTPSSTALSGPESGIGGTVAPNRLHGVAQIVVEADAEVADSATVLTTPALTIATETATQDHRRPRRRGAETTSRTTEPDRFVIVPVPVSTDPVSPPLTTITFRDGACYG